MLGLSAKLNAGLKMRDLVKNTLRMRPDRIILGEVRGEELFELLQAMNTGHDGSMTSIHANSPAECIQRMETLFLMSGFEMPNIVVRKQISTAVDFIIQLGRTREGLRTIVNISEVTGMEGPTIQMQNLGTFEENKIKYSGLAPKNWAKIAESGLPLDFLGKELK
jgi:pilus assembly protein CpaF